MEKSNILGKNGESSKYMDTKKTTKSKRRTRPSTMKNRDIPSPSHVFNTLGTNPSSVSIGDDVTSPIKSMTMSGGRKGG